jgi:hypothetical protein
MKMYGEYEYCSMHTPRERAAGTHRIEGWVGHGTGLDEAVNRKFRSPCWESNSGRPALSLVAIMTDIPLSIILYSLNNYNNNPKLYKLSSGLDTESYT